jgi:thiol-disulfide isomerase/thioredoxin
MRWICVLLALVSVGCESNTQETALPSRVIAVSQKTTNTVSLAEFCDVLTPKNQPRPFQWPEVNGSLPEANRTPLWVNVWATWCKPCLEEMPRLVTWHQSLAKQDILYQLAFLSVDENPDTVAQLRKTVPQIPETLYLKNASDLSSFIKEIGLDPGAGLPIHIFVDKQRNIKCTRAASISQTDLEAVMRLLR